MCRYTSGWQSGRATSSRILSIHASTPPKSASRVNGGAYWVNTARWAEVEVTADLERLGVAGSLVLRDFRLTGAALGKPAVPELDSLGELGAVELWPDSGAEAGVMPS